MRTIANIRSLKALLVIGLAALANSACGGSQVIHISPGRPPVFAGAPESYWIWHDEGGWHLRTTTMSQNHRFHGTIIPANGGSITGLVPTRTEWNDRIRVGPNGIEFSFETQGNEDGFDWRVSSGCNQFNLMIDNHVDVSRIHLGGANHSPQHMPFDRCR